MTDDHREDIRRSLRKVHSCTLIDTIRSLPEIPQHVQRCCARCYDKLIVEVRQRQTNQAVEEEDDDEDEEEYNNNGNSSVSIRTNPKHDNGSESKKSLDRAQCLFVVSDDWTPTEIEAFMKAVEKFNGNWRQIAEYVQRTEQSCRTFYKKQQKAMATDDVCAEEPSVKVMFIALCSLECC